MVVRKEVCLTQSEWYVMDCLWAYAPQTVMQLATDLSQRAGWAKSTTITTLRRMEDKGLVTVEIHGRTKYYTPALERDKAVRRETRSFLDRVYQGSVGLMVSAVAQEKTLSQEEIDALYAILKEAEKQ